AGSEIEQRVNGLRSFTCSVQILTSPTVGDSTARALLEKCQLGLALPSIRSALADAGITPYDVGPVQNISALKDAKFEGRALLDVGFYTRLSVSDFTTYIETVEATSYMGPPDLGTSDEIDI